MKTPRDILNKLATDCMEPSVSDIGIDQALKEIDEFYRSKFLKKKELSNDELAMYIGYINGSETLAEKIKMLNKIINKET